MINNIVKTAKTRPKTGSSQQPDSNVYMSMKPEELAKTETEPPKPKNFWVNLNAIRSVERRADGSGKYSVLFINDTHVYTFNINPLEMEGYAIAGWVCL